MAKDYQELRQKLAEERKAEGEQLYADWTVEHPMLAGLFMEPERKGASRGCGSLTIFFEDGRFKAALGDRKLNSTAFITIENPETFFDDLEAKVRNMELDWRKK